MNEAFRQFADSLHPAFERLLNMSPVTAGSIPRHAPNACIYLFSEGNRHLYAGRTKNFRQRMGNHSNPSSSHNQAALAFRLACETSGKSTVPYSKDKGRACLATDPDFDQAFIAAKARVRAMALRFVEELDPTKQALLEIYASVALSTPYNNFETH